MLSHRITGTSSVCPWQFAHTWNKELLNWPSACPQGAVCLCHSPLEWMFFQVLQISKLNPEYPTAKSLACGNNCNDDKNIRQRTFLVVQWLRICLLMQGVWVRCLVQKDPMCHRAMKPVCRNLWAPALGLKHHNERHPCLPQLEKACAQQRKTQVAKQIEICK